MVRQDQVSHRRNHRARPHGNGLAYIASPEYGPAKIGPVRNYLKTATEWFEKKLLKQL